MAATPPPKRIAAAATARLARPALAMLALLLLLLGAAMLPSPVTAQPGGSGEVNQCQDYARQLNLLRSRVHMTLFSADQGKMTDSDRGGGSHAVSAQAAAAQRDYDTLRARFQLLCGGGGGEITIHCCGRGQRGEGRGMREKRIRGAVADFIFVCLCFSSSLSVCAPRLCRRSPQGRPRLLRLRLRRPPAPTRAR